MLTSPMPDHGRKQPIPSNRGMALYALLRLPETAATDNRRATIALFAQPEKNRTGALVSNIKPMVPGRIAHDLHGSDVNVANATKE